MQLDLLRSESIPDGTFGILRIGALEFHTAEDDWLQNLKGKSCIPAGEYTLKRTIYHRHGFETFEVTGVPGRSRILIHPGNTEEDVEGCILLGMYRGMMQRKDEDTGLSHQKHAVLDSKVAFGRFMAAMEGIDTATLAVRWAPGLP